jgi:hypothetical protein
MLAHGRRLGNTNSKLVVGAAQSRRYDLELAKLNEKRAITIIITIVADFINAQIKEFLYHP